MKIVINTSHSLFALSEVAVDYIRKKIKNKEIKEKIFAFSFDNDRSHPLLIEAVEKLGSKASTENSRLKIIEIPDGVHWEIHGYNGKEWIAECHRTWGKNEENYSN
jgi:NurA-like 5'-3' nuclease